jgi:hypothetical protein
VSNRRKLRGTPPQPSKEDLELLACQLVLANLDRDAPEAIRLLTSNPLHAATGLLALVLQVGPIAYGSEARMRQVFAAAVAGKATDECQAGDWPSEPARNCLIQMRQSTVRVAVARSRTGPPARIAAAAKENIMAKGKVVKTTTSAGTTGKPTTPAQHGTIATTAPRKPTKPGKGR